MSFPPFRPHPWLRGGHRQTLAGALWPRRVGPSRATLRWVELPDGDRLALHDDAPETSSSALSTRGEKVPGAVLLVHGLAGCHTSGYMVRIARRLNATGLRTFRLELRGCGAGRGHAKLPYHAGRSEDVRAAVESVLALTGSERLSVVGFSLGGNIVLKWAGEQGASLSPRVRNVLAVNPPVDLAECTRQIERSAGGWYDRHFTRLLYRQLRGSSQWNADSPLAREGKSPRRLIEFDDLFTAPLSGFGTAANYYSLASAANVIDRIAVRTLILTAADDPLIPAATLTSLRLPPLVTLHVAEGGGHLGYLAARGGSDPDRHWLDWRIVDWLRESIGST